MSGTGARSAHDASLILQTGYFVGDNVHYIPQSRGVVQAPSQPPTANLATRVHFVCEPPPDHVSHVLETAPSLVSGTQRSKTRPTAKNGIRESTAARWLSQATAITPKRIGPTVDETLFETA